MPTFTMKTSFGDIEAEILYGRGQVVIHRTPEFDDDSGLVSWSDGYTISLRNGYAVMNVPAGNLKRVIETAEELRPLFEDMPMPDRHAHNGPNWKWVQDNNISKKVAAIRRMLFRRIRWDIEAQMDVEPDNAHPASEFYDPGPYTA